ncbi:DUF2381 family protein [Stigmatella sp. ncwal1]|uniref:DUF2381 family protein n=1 Tax=Stigmatella ashevillensis TaxID=2995309 RepID=A0ABT5DE34_9BACT|nr:DUF2381 family protein [Stigmatella ashevillena]
MTLALCLLVAAPAFAQLPSPHRQRQDRRVSLPTQPGEPPPEVHVAPGYITVLMFNSPLERDSLEVDRTRFKWVDLGERTLNLEPAAELGASERLVVKVRFKDRALPSQAVLGLVAHPTEVDGRVEVDRRANTPEALLNALTLKTAEVEDLKARCEENGPVGLALSGWLTRDTSPIVIIEQEPSAETRGLQFRRGVGFQGGRSTLVTFHLLNRPDQRPWTLGQARLTEAGGGAATVLSAQMRPPSLAPGEKGLVVLEAATAPWVRGTEFSVELADASGQRLLFLNLRTQ